MTNQKFSKRVVRFCAQSHRLLDILSEPNVNPKKIANITEYRSSYEVNQISCGVINSFWQAWNRLCREYWCCFIYGGELSSRANIASICTLTPITINSNTQKDMFNFLVPTNSIWQKKCSKGLIFESQEPTWGATKSLSEIAAYYQRFYSEISCLSGSLSMSGNVLDHIQKVRNAAIHMNASSCDALKGLSSHYSFTQKNEYPADYLYAIELATGKKAIQYWIDEVTTIANLMCP
jgi:hypothetical protein